jgi:hypothetical protein
MSKDVIFLWTAIAGSMIWCCVFNIRKWNNRKVLNANTIPVSKPYLVPQPPPYQEVREEIFEYPPSYKDLQGLEII